MEQSNPDIDLIYMNFFFNESININQKETKRVITDALQLPRMRLVKTTQELTSYVYIAVWIWLL